MSDETPRDIYLALRKELADIDDVVKIQGVNWKLAGDAGYQATAFWTCEDEQDSITLPCATLNPDAGDIAAHLAILIREKVGEIS